jgi:uncharacterized oxidoreductase
MMGVAMKTTSNTILITGGATGIGLALAEAFVREGNKVIICGRRQTKLDEAKERLPQIQARPCDLSKIGERESLCNWIKDNHPDLNILINNAGVSKSINFTKGTAELLRGEDEIEINLVAPVHLSALFAPLLAEKNEAAIVNVTSGLGFVPLAGVPLYAASKSALHSFSISLRHQLKDTSIKVFEIVPPIVDTDLGKDATDASVRQHIGIPPSEVATATIEAFQKDEYEIVIGEARRFVEGSKRDFDEIFQALNNS